MNTYIKHLEKKIKESTDLPLTVLKPPVCTSFGFDRGVLFCSPTMLQLLLNHYSQNYLKERWLIIDSLQQYGYGENLIADLHLIASPQLINEYLNSPYGTIPFCTLGDGGDFVNPLYFYPLLIEQKYDIIFVASWAPFKRHFRLLEAAQVLKAQNKSIRILIVGSYCVPGHIDTMEEALNYEKGVRQMVKEYNLEVDFIDNKNIFHINQDGSSVLGIYTKTQINNFINQARLGVLVSHQEGTTRFVAECLCANKPVIILNSLKAGTTKYINELTGMVADDTPEGLAEVIASALDNLDKFSPRNNFLSKYGFFNSNRKLEDTILKILKNQQDQNFTIPNCQFGGDMWSFDYYNVFLPVMSS